MSTAADNYGTRVPAHQVCLQLWFATSLLADAVAIAAQSLLASCLAISDTSGANSVVQYLFDEGAALDVVALDGRTPLRVADGVEYGNSFATHPHTAELLRELGAQDDRCITQLGGCALLSADGEVLYEWRDTGICNTAHFEDLLRAL